MGGNFFQQKIDFYIKNEEYGGSHRAFFQKTKTETETETEGEGEGEGEAQGSRLRAQGSELRL